MENNIKIYRIAQGLSQQALADLAGISRPNLSKLENNKYPPCVESMEKIAKALKVPVKNIFLTICYTWILIWKLKFIVNREE